MILEARASEKYIVVYATHGQEARDRLIELSLLLGLNFQWLPDFFFMQVGMIDNRPYDKVYRSQAEITGEYDISRWEAIEAITRTDRLPYV